MRKIALALTSIIVFLVVAKITFEVIHLLEKKEEDAEWIYPTLEFRSTTQTLLESRWLCSGSGCLDSADIHRLSWEIHKFSEIFDLSASRSVRILMVENPWLDSLAVSSAGALGLMQVMPFHAGAWGEECGKNLVAISSNLCHSFKIRIAYALLRYNGCTLRYCRDYVRRIEDDFS